MEFIWRFYLLNSQAQGASGKNEQSTQTPWRGAQCSCIGCIGLRPWSPQDWTANTAME